MLSLDMKRGNTPLITVVVIFVIAAVVGVLYFATNNSAPQADLPTPSSAMEEDKMMDDGAMDNDSMEDESMTESDANYVQYQKAGYEKIADTRHVLFFYANWCPTCKPADAEFQAQMSKLPVPLVRVNYNDTATDADEKALANELGVTYQHTFVLMENGQAVKRWNGGSLDKLLSEVN